MAPVPDRCKALPLSTELDVTGDLENGARSKQVQGFTFKNNVASN